MISPQLHQPGTVVSQSKSFWAPQKDSEHSCDILSGIFSQLQPGQLHETNEQAQTWRVEMWLLSQDDLIISPDLLGAQA